MSWIRNTGFPEQCAWDHLFIIDVNASLKDEAPPWGELKVCWVGLGRDLRGRRLGTGVGPYVGLGERNLDFFWPAWRLGKPKLLQIAIVIIHRLVAFQARDTLVMNALY
jgi:hypothetical protein